MHEADGHAPHPVPRRRTISAAKTARLAQRGWEQPSWPVMPPVGRGSQPPRPITRPARPLLVPLPAAEPPVRRGPRVLLIIVCLIVGMTALALVAEGILLATGRSPF